MTARLLHDLDALERRGGEGVVQVDGAPLRLTHLDKVWFPELGLTKGDVLRYYVRVAPAILRVLRDRPLVLVRYPNGIHGPRFHQHAATDAPDGVRAEPVPGVSDQPRYIGGDLRTLLHTVQLGAISAHAWPSRVGSPTVADWVTLDLDPQPKAPFPRVVDVAHQVREALAAEGIGDVLCKTSGSRGLHLLGRLAEPTSLEEARALATRVAEAVAAAHPRDATAERARAKRGAATVFVDAGQNAPGKSVAAAYALRARPGATVSTPLAWEEVTRTLDPAVFTIATVPDRLTSGGDLWREWMDG